MLRFVRDAVTLAVLMASIGASAFSLYRAWRQPFPPAIDLASLDFEEYLVERDLRQESRATKVHLLRQFESNLGKYGPWAFEQRSQLVGAENERFVENAWQLAEIWYFEKVNLYHDWPANRREQNLDREIDRVARLFSPPRNERQRGNPPGGFPAFDLQGLVGGFAGLTLLVQLQQRVDEWTERAEPAMQPRMREFQEALQKRVVAGKFGQAGKKK